MGRRVTIPDDLMRDATTRTTNLVGLSTVDNRKPAPRKVVFSVSGRPVPWSVPKTVRRKNPALVSWQAIVNLFARRAMAGRRPMAGRVAIRFVFYLNPSPSDPDTTNLQKACEDALQNAVIEKDRQTSDIRSTRVFQDGWEGVTVIVEALK